jgi:N-acyl-D-aspartate/D-glutamate deacylase
MAFDTLIRKGTVIDGTGRPRFDADIGISAGRIEAIGALQDAEATHVIEAAGHVVAPGFIDMHSHSDRSLLDDPGAESKVHQGVTTEVVGNCAASPFPTTGERDVILEGSHPSAVEVDWTDVDGWANRLETNGISLNVAPQVGHSALRTVAGVTDNRPPTEDELDTMRRLAAESVEQGAYAVTTGLTLPPSSYATTDEIVSIVQATRHYDGVFYTSHTRVWAGWHIKAVEECVEVGRRAGVPVQHSHMGIVDPRIYRRGDELVAVIDRARADGMDVTYDMHPYAAAATHLQQLTPEWLQEGGELAMLDRLREPETRQRAVEETSGGYFRGLPFEWDKLVLANLSSDRNQNLVGSSIADVAEARNTSGVETMLALIDEEDNKVGVVAHNRDEGDIRFFMAHPQAMIGSDGVAMSPTGIYANDRPHPRFYGTYPRILGRYVREQPAVLTLEEAVFKMTGFPARRMSFTDRGTIASKNVADLVIFDPATVQDRATYDDPHRFPVGIPHVLVAGVPVVLDGQHTGARPGKVIRRGA